MSDERVQDFRDAFDQMVKATRDAIRAYDGKPDAPEHSDAYRKLIEGLRCGLAEYDDRHGGRLQ